MHPDLFPYQRDGARWLAQKRNAILADAMGLGKTSQAIAACDEAGLRRVLVVCPGVARTNWQREFERWQAMPRSVAVMRSSKFLPDPDVLVTSYSLIRSIKALRSLLDRNWDVIVLDEAHLGKNPAALTARCLYGNDTRAKYGLASRADRAWLLSGTIMPNNPSELWSHCHALFPDVVDNGAGGRLGYSAWTETFCRTSDHEANRIVGAKNQGELVRRLRPHVMRRTMEEVHKDMPALRVVATPLMPDKLPPRSAEVAEAEAVVAAALAKASGGKDGEDGRLALQGVSDMHLGTLRRWTGVAKAPAIADQVNADLADGMDRIVLFALHREVFDILLRDIPGSVALRGDTPERMRQRYIDGFQGRIPGFAPNVILCHVDIASTALTLTASCNVGMAEQTWVVKDTLQAIKRCHRIGQPRPVLARVFSLAGSVDEQIGATLARKARELTAFDKALERKDQA